MLILFIMALIVGFALGGVAGMLVVVVIWALLALLLALVANI